MEVYEAIEKRGSVRVFERGVSAQQLRRIIVAGTKAPSGSNVQPWEFIIIDDPGIIEQIAEHKYQQTLKMAIDEMIVDDPRIVEQICQQTLDNPVSLKRARIQKDAYRNCTVIAVCNKIWHGMGRKPWMNIENIASTWMCIENMQVAATADGLGILTSIFREEHKVAVEKLLGILEDYELATMVLIGVEKEFLSRQEILGRIRAEVRPTFTWLHRNRFGTSVTL
ncbi:nitroreductase family protein [Chloroflexota bacterium]